MSSSKHVGFVPNSVVTTCTIDSQPCQWPCLHAGKWKYYYLTRAVSSPTLDPGKEVVGAWRPSGSIGLQGQITVDCKSVYFLQRKCSLAIQCYSFIKQLTKLEDAQSPIISNNSHQLL